MLVKYEVQDIPKKGKGLVATEPIPKGTQVWKYRDTDHLIYDSKEELMTAVKEHVPDMNKEKVMEFLSHLYTGNDGKRLFLAYEIDDSHYFNHSGSNPNCGSPTSIAKGKKQYGIDISKDPIGTYAYRDIKKGEELLINYDKDKVFLFPDWLMEIRKEYGMETSTAGWD